VSGFRNACDRFETLDAEPYVEGRYSVNINAIKTQKIRYVSSLKHILADMRLESADATNSYEKYAHALSALEGTVKNILEVNANFKIVLYCYANHLWDFKSLFSEIERHTSALKGELEARSDEFSKYSDVRSHISTLVGYYGVLDELRKGVDALKADPKEDGGDLDADSRNTNRMLVDKKAELARLSADAAGIHNRITLLTLPLERASKKLDYASASRSKLHVFVENPIGAINSQSECDEFMSLVRELNNKINEGRMDLKNGDKVKEAASILLATDVYSLICAFKAGRQAEAKAKVEIDGLERRLSAIMNEKLASERRTHEIVSMDARMRETEKNKDAEKQAIGRLFMECYGVAVSVTD
jgi:hypothetical protein